MLHLMKAYGDGDNDDAESQVDAQAQQKAEPSQANTEAQGDEDDFHGGLLLQQKKRRSSRWDIYPAVLKPSEPSLIQAQLTALEGQVQAQQAQNDLRFCIQQAQNDLRFCILGRPFIEVVAGAIILWAVGTEQQVRVTKVSQAFKAWKTKLKTRILAEKVGLEKRVLFAKAFKCVKARNSAAHFGTFASLQRGVLEARTLIEVDQGYFKQHVPEQVWCIDNYDVISEVFNFEGVSDS